MRAVFADTFYWIALVNRHDASHGKAAQCARNYSGLTITTEWVLTEVVDGFAAARHRHLMEPWRRLWRTDDTLTIIEATHGLFEEGLNLFCHRPDKS